MIDITRINELIKVHTCVECVYFSKKYSESTKHIENFFCTKRNLVPAIDGISTVNQMCDDGKRKHLE